MTATSNRPAGMASDAKTSSDWGTKLGLAQALIALAVIVMLPAVKSLPVAGQVMLGILAFAVIVWMTEALDYSVSAVVIGALMIFLLAAVPDVAKPAGPDVGTVNALNLALSGFSSSAVALVAAACFIAAALERTLSGIWVGALEYRDSIWMPGPHAMPSRRGSGASSNTPRFDTRRDGRASVDDGLDALGRVTVKACAVGDRARPAGQCVRHRVCLDVVRLDHAG